MENIYFLYKYLNQIKYNILVQNLIYNIILNLKDYEKEAFDKSFH